MRLLAENWISEQRKFYDLRWKTSKISSKELARVERTVTAIPKGCERILDVGCGDGLVSERVKEHTGALVAKLDFSFTALSRNSGNRFCAVADSLPFRDHSFDLVMTTEILEHIPETVYPRVLHELARVARKYVLITVPNQENLSENFACCGKCGNKFHVWGHVRRYTPSILRNLLPGFKPVTIEPFGDKYTSYNQLLLPIKQQIGGAWCWEQGRTSCFACGNTEGVQAKNRTVVRICDALNYRCWELFGRQEPWLLALYARSEGARPFVI